MGMEGGTSFVHSSVSIISLLAKLWLIRRVSRDAAKVERKVSSFRLRAGMFREDRGLGAWGRLVPTGGVWGGRDTAGSFVLGAGGKGWGGGSLSGTKP